MRKRSNKFEATDHFDRAFLPEESTESARAIAIDLSDRLGRLEQQVLSQYAATAAYATLAQQHTDTARAEARADLDRSQSTVIGLLESLRTELKHRLDGVDARLESNLNASGGDGAPRLIALDQRVASLSAAFEQLLRENHQLRNEVNELTKQRMLDDGWLASDGPSSQLSLS